MKNKLLALSFGVGAMILAADSALARTNCHARDLVVTRLAERYGESRQSIGLAANNSVVEVFASLETGTWTITVTSPGFPGAGRGAAQFGQPGLPTRAGEAQVTATQISRRPVRVRRT